MDFLYREEYEHTSLPILLYAHHLTGICDLYVANKMMMMIDK